ncbi:MAG: hypothetical protein EOO09_08165 [Chitinophagaceae bacterium]|nr:MAG: hypothetical protein EOO09_08165 [Chitinophagaceae bacterium]
MRLIILLLLLTPAAGFCQDVFYVSHIQGPVKKNMPRPVKASKIKVDSLLKIGETIGLKDSLHFSKSTDYVSVISPTKGNFILRADKKSVGRGAGEFVLAVNEIFVPAVKTNTMGTRSGMISSMYDLENYLARFTDSTRMVIAGTRKILLNGAAFPEPEANYYFVSYNYRGERINKKLSIDKVAGKGFNLILDRSLFRIDGKDFDPAEVSRMAFQSRDADAGTNQLLDSISVRYADEAVLVEELRLVQRVMLLQGIKDMEELDAGIRSHLAANWGLVDEDDLQQLLLQVRKPQPVN